ncbi:hypothetical protein KGF56_000755 [Candida oxycetoniae]|uniref:Pre-mRNA-splicing factor SPF27 n=1 Tax=Candida oxycetoniae TaxID=497107 RepID=A0AAI9T0N1_9ASCO|nr:uncharacterized protein KGF56_000755 [Candida oxycetoniae]KAI3406275.2 hypothetical protein KGF56_000755 [Candida oxycetoniae]
MVTIDYEPLTHLKYIDEYVGPEERAHVEQLVRLELASQFNANINNLTNHTNNVEADTVAIAENSLIVDTDISSNLPIHPLVEQLVPSIGNDLQFERRNVVDMRLQRYEEEESDNDEGEDEEDVEGVEEGKKNKGVDMTKYADFNIISPAEPGSSSSSSSSSAEERDGINYTNLYITLGHATLRQRNLDLFAQNQEALKGLQKQHLEELRNYNQMLANGLNKKRIMVDEVEEMRKKRQLNDYKPVYDYLDNRWKQGINTALNVSIEKARKAYEES